MSGQTAAVGQGALAALPLSSDNWRHGGLSIGALRDGERAIDWGQEEGCLEDVAFYLRHPRRLPPQERGLLGAWGGWVEYCHSGSG